MPKKLAKAIGQHVPAVRRLVEQRDALVGQRDALVGQRDALVGQRDALVEQRDALIEQRDAQAAELKVLEGLPWPPGHFYSPFPSLDDVRSRRARIFSCPSELPEIDPDADGQLSLVAALSPLAHAATLPDHPEDGYRYHYENDFFSYGDGLVLHCMLRWLEPAQIIEIGSGFSSALILDTNERNLGGQMECTFIEPYPDRLMGLLRSDDDTAAEILAAPVQDVGSDFADKLHANDVLFIDSSHVSKVGSDVNLLIFEILPSLPKGVFVHFHDIFYPFEYPESWVLEGRGWNESYLLRAYLQANPGFRIRLWNSYLDRFHRAEVAAALPNWGRNPGGSIWLERL